MSLLTFDLGGTSVKHGVWKNETLIETGSFSTPKTYIELKEIFQKILDDSTQKHSIKGLAFSMPGAVNVEAAKIEGISAIPYIHDFNIFEDLEQHFSLPVSIENDANCAGICEVKIGAAKKARNTVFLVLGTGIGGAVFINRQLYKGSHLFAGEFGVMKLNDGDIFSLQGSAIALGKSHPQNLTAKEIFEGYDQGDQVAISVVNEWLNKIALGLYNIQMTLDPELVVLGGGVSQRSDLAKLISEKLQAKLTAEKVGNIMPEIQSCQYFNDANLIGAALNFIELKNKVSSTL